ncbi:hypothetical protein FACS1894168_2920 [Deltaproteobacteria bacterium]|nr:hypothetical protein FACS1894168_2920 [Deltaproteobacteria bacterium]
MKKMNFVWFLCVIAGIAWYVFSDGTFSAQQIKQKFIKEAKEVIAENASTGDIAALAMRAISLTQGEHGAALWRLKAEWGKMRRADDIMDLEMPKFTYYMSPDDTELTLVSRKGEIDQKEQLILFIDDVVVVYEGRRLDAPFMRYLGKTKEMVCPQGAKVTGKDMAGSADSLVWNLQEQVLQAFGNVDVTFESERDNLFSPRGKPEAQQRKNEKNAS